MARKTPLRCAAGMKRFTVVRINGDPHDTHAGRSFERAMDLAMPDPGSRVEVFVTCARDGSEARLPANYEKRGVLVRSFRRKGRR